MDSGQLCLLLASIFGFLMAWGVGANDVSNAMGTSVGSKAITVKQAILIATVFECLGAVIAGGDVTNTIRSGILDPHLFTDAPEALVYGMLASLLAAAIWLGLASHFGWPVSTTHTIVGAIVGFGAMQLGLGSVEWLAVGNIVLGWLISPLIGGTFAYVCFMSVQRFILDKPHPFKEAQKVVPAYIFLVAWIIAMITLHSGLTSLGLHFNFFQNFLMATGLALFTTLVGIFLLRRIKIDKEADKRFHFTSVEKIFSVLMIFTACAMAFAHGSNDVANAIGPLAAIANVVNDGGISDNAPVPFWILGIGAGGIVIGLLTYGYKVMATIGTKITHLTPSRGFAATLAAAVTVVLASSTGYPISTTHTLVGAVLGVGLARGISALNLNVIRTIFMSWVITLPAGAFLSVLCYHILERLFVISL